MNHQDSRSVITKIFSPTALALALGLALAFPGSAALATNNPIPGVDIIVKKNPGGIAVVVPIDDSGKFSVKLGPGDYTVSTDCKSGACAPNRISIDIKDYNLELKADGSTSYEFHVGKGGIELRGQTLSIDPPRGAGANGAPGKANQPIITKDVENGETQAFRGNRPILDEQASTPVKLQQPPPNQLREKETGGGDGELPGKHNYKGVVTLVKGVAPPNDGAGELPGRAGDFKGTVTLVKGMAPRPGGGGVKPGISDQGATGGLISYRTAPPPKDGTLPGILRIINNSETESANVNGSTPVNGIGGLGGGRFTFKPTSPVADSANVETSNRDHIDQDAQTDIKKRTAVQSGGPGDARRVTDFGPDSEDVELAGKKAAPKPTSPGTGPHRSLTADQPIAGLNVKLGKNPGGSIEVNATLNSSGAVLAAETMFSSTTDSQGNFHFGQLPAGNYKLILPDLTSLSLTVDSDGIAGGTVMRGPDGSVSIFDRWGEQLTAPPPKAGDAKRDTPDQTAGSKAAESPVGFGSGNNAMGAGPGAGLGAGPGMSPAMGGAGGLSPMSPVGPGPMGAGGPMGGSLGGAMRP